MSASDSVAPNLYPDVLAAPDAVAASATSRPLFVPALAPAEMFLEFVLAAGGFLLASVGGSFISGSFAGSLRAGAPNAIAVALLIVFLLHHNDDTQDRGNGLLRIRGTERTLRRTWQAIFLVAGITALWTGHLSVPTMLLSAGIIPALLIGKGQILFSFLRLRTAANRTMVYGAGDSARAIVSALRNSPGTGLHPIGIIEDDFCHSSDRISLMDYRPAHSVPVHRGPVTPGLLLASGCNVLLIAGANLRGESAERAIRAARDAGLATAFVYSPPAAHQQKCINLDGFLLVTSAESAAMRLYPSLKRAIDVLGSALLVLIMAPLLLLIAALIRVDSPGAALFIQERVGRDGRLFRMYKFRSMYTGSPCYAHSPVSSDDPRITRIGRLLRRMSLDELPQLMNVLAGDMSLVGPRPEMPFIVDQYGPEERRRLQVLPGITGLWQLSADRAHPIHENLEYDLYYIRNRTLSMDLAILIHTLIFALRRGI